jgi:hypothetical protein
MSSTFFFSVMGASREMKFMSETRDQGKERGGLASRGRAHGCKAGASVIASDLAPIGEHGDGNEDTAVRITVRREDAARARV